MGCKPYRGVLTGFNEAFFIDDTTRKRLIDEDPKSAEVIKPLLRGRDIRRWVPDWQNVWLIFSRRGIDIDSYPAIKNHLLAYREKLEPKPKGWKGAWKGRKPGSYQWYEIQDSVDYWEEFEKPKIIYQVIQTLPNYSFDDTGAFGNDKTFILPCDKPFYILAVLNSPLLWWISHRVFTKMLSGSISPMGYIFGNLPIARPTDEIRAEVEPNVERLIELTLESRLRAKFDRISNQDKPSATSIDSQLFLNPFQRNTFSFR